MPAVRALASVPLFAAIVMGPCFAQQSEPGRLPTEPLLHWLRDYLAEFSLVTFAASDTRGRETVTTGSRAELRDGRLLLEYQRITYTNSDPEEVEQRQIIFYTVPLDSLDPDSVGVADGAAADDGAPYWMVSVSTRPDRGHIEYDNMFESRAEDGTPELTRSRGRVRQVVLGYFSKEELARRLATTFRGSLRAPGRGEAAPTRQDRSVA